MLTMLTTVHDIAFAVMFLFECFRFTTVPDKVFPVLFLETFPALHSNEQT